MYVIKGSKFLNTEAFEKIIRTDNRILFNPIKYSQIPQKCVSKSECLHFISEMNALNAMEAITETLKEGKSILYIREAGECGIYYWTKKQNEQL